MLEQIKQALEEKNLVRGVAVVPSAAKDDWLRYLIGEVERLEKERLFYGQLYDQTYKKNEKLQKALEQIYHLRPVACEWTDEKYYEKFAECEDIARQALERSEPK